MPVLPVIAGIASLVLMYILGARLFANARFGIATACLFALTPLLWQLGQDRPVSLYPLPFVACWLAAIACSDRTPQSVWFAVAGAALGLGVHSSRAAIVMMPLYLALTIATLMIGQGATRRQLGILIAAFTVAIVPAALSLANHPENFRNTVNAYHLYDADRFSVRQGVREMASWVGLTARSEVYYDYFNPSFLFLSGRVLLLPLVVLVPVGLYQILTDENTLLARLSIAGFLVAPFAASLTADRPTPGRILFITPFAAVVSAYGIWWLLARWQAWRGVSSAEG